MRIKDGLKLPGRKVEIPNCGRDDFAKFLHDDMGFKVGVEIGVDKGNYSEVLCKAGLKVYGVDPWENYDEYKREGYFVSNKEETIKRLKDYDWTPIVKYSVDAAKDFDDESIDFVYIDGNHTLPYVCHDIFAWERKVKYGGIISGHDYARIYGHRERHTETRVWDGCHVSHAVDASVDVMQVRKYYILGKKNEGYRDKWRSWFFFKNG